MSKSRYKNAQFQKMWLTILASAEDKSSELYLPDGSQHRGANHRCAFWDGYNGVLVTSRAGVSFERRLPLYVIPNTLSMVCYMAGKEFKRRSTFGRKNKMLEAA